MADRHRHLKFGTLAFGALIAVWCFFSAVRAVADDGNDVQWRSVEQEALPPTVQNAIEDEGFLVSEQSRIEALEAEVQKLKFERQQSEVSEGMSTDFVIHAKPGKGIMFRAKDGRYSLDLRARIQTRGVVASGGTKPATSDINIQTLRFYLQGNVIDPKLTYLIQFAFGNNDFEVLSSSPVYDAWVNYEAHRDVNVRVGQYFVPFDRARSVREFALHLIDRQQAIRELALDRDAGLMLYSDDLFGAGHKLGYNVGVFGGDGRNYYGSPNAGLLYSGRLFYRPFGKFNDDTEGDLDRLRDARVLIGVGAAYNQNTSRVQSVKGTVYSLGGFDYAHLESDVMLKWAGLYMLAEVLYRRGTQDFRDGTSASGAALREWSRSGWGYLFDVGMMLTDQLEVAGRWSQLYALNGTDPSMVDFVRQQGHELGGGLNFYLNGHYLKIQTDYFYLFGDTFSDGRHVARVQLDATF